ncbi:MULTISPECIES: glycosyltransferase [unclassified Desulfovibrio]|uniref:glycosyltransferase n=1 Tax=unclassified Desulfovibrio TaxID=2593640 RepID=UPI0013EB7A83|nr:MULTISPECIES: glycosyltransferase [unclassified Desulfovibrio]
MAPVIIAKDLYKCYAGFAPVLRGVSLEVEAGEMVAIMGPSGCGKSTMLHILGLLHAPDAGSLTILGTDVLKLTREQTAAFRRGNLGFVMQSSNLFEHSTVFENVEFPLIYEKVPPQERWERVIRALELVRLSARVHYRSNRLSGGEQQRVAIARAMVNNPRILLADEPTGALDAKTSRLIMDNFRALCHSGGVSMVMVTHDPKMAEFCDSVYTLEDGILHCRKHELADLKEGATKSLLAAPDPIVRGALVAERFPEPSGQCLMEIAHHLHAAGLLSRIYAIRGSGLLGNPAGYALPLAVRRIGLWHAPAALGALVRRARASQSLWSLWRHMPHSRWGRGFFAQVWAFACGTLLARWGLQERIEFFYASGAGNQATASLVAARLLRLPFAFSVRAQDLSLNGADWAVKAQEAVFVRCDTEAVVRALRERLPGLPADKIVLLRDPLTLTPPEEEVETIPTPAGSAPEAVKPLELLAVGTIAPRKGYDLLLRACARLKQAGIDFRLAIVGQGPARLKLRWLSWRLGLRRLVRFAGEVAHEKMAETYRHTDIFVSPGIKTRKGEMDGLPSALAEAMAFGIAVVVSDLPGQLEAVENGVTGLVVPQNDVPALAQALERLAKDPEERKRLGAAARQRIHALLDAQASEEKLKELFIEAARSAARAKEGAGAAPGGAETSAAAGAGAPANAPGEVATSAPVGGSPGKGRPPAKKGR